MTKKLLETKGEIEVELARIASEHPEAKGIVIFAPSLSWSGQLFQRPQQMARALARMKALVFYVQPHAIWPPWFMEIEPNLILCQTPLDAFHVLPEAFVYALPWNLSLLTHFAKHRIIYDYLDDLSVFSDVPNLHAHHRHYLQQAEIVIASARRLFDETRAYRHDVLFIPNAVDVTHFSRPIAPVLPEDLKPVLSVGQPILGYHGALARWFDYSLVQEIAQARRDVSIVLLGPDYDSSISRSSLLEEPNIHWLGVKPYEQLPDYIAHFTIGFIPFVVNEITNATSPIKLFEYFAARKPVIVSPMQESASYPYVLVAKDVKEWIECIDQALQKAADPDFQQELFQYALQNSWENRAADLLEGMLAKPYQHRNSPHLSILVGGILGKAARLLAKAIKITRTAGIRGLLRGIYYKSYGLWHHHLFRLREHFFGHWKEYILEDNSELTLYTNRLDLYPEYQPRRMLPGLSHPLPKVTVISTCKNERANAEAWVASLARQSLPPAEVIVVDAGSEDGTAEVIKAAAQKYHLPFKLIEKPGASIAAGRNSAIQEASSPIIVSLDFDCLPYPDWLEKLVQPFQLEPHTEIAAGWYRAITPDGSEPHFPISPCLGQISPQDFIPSSRSLAFTKEAWAKIGGYPEWLTLSGEDTYFALEGKRLCSHWAFVPEAIVEWRVPGSWYRLWEKARAWAMGDGEIGYNARRFRHVFLKTIWKLFVIFVGLVGVGELLWLGAQGISWAGWLGILLAAFAILIPSVYFWVKEKDFFYLVGRLGLNLAWLLGFWSGAKRQEIAARERLEKTKGVFFILSGPPMEDTGGGSRSAQMALELLRQGYWVIYINRYPSYETRRIPISVAHPNLFRFELPSFSWTQFRSTYSTLLPALPKVVLAEFPSPDFLPLLMSLKSEGCKIVYEMIDDWNTSLGGSWYLPEVEQKFIQMSDILIGTAPPLQEKLTQMSGRVSFLLPNAVNRRLFDPRRHYPRPSDLPEAEWSAIYIGALWGEWFDWDLLVALAQRYPEASIVVIGDYRGQCPNPPSNLKFLGLRPQRALPSYLAHVDVGIIPWKVGPITQATSPLKLYEYLAMHRPVVAPDLFPLHGIPGVFLARDGEEFLQLVDQIRRVPLDVDAVEAFIYQNDWSARVRQLLQWLHL